MPKRRKTKLPWLWLEGSEGEMECQLKCGCRLIRDYGGSGDPAFDMCPTHRAAGKALPITTYLVIGRCGVDDVPIRLCGTKAEANRLAKRTSQRAIFAAAAILGVDPLIFCNVSVVVFEDGVPIACYQVKEFRR